MYLKRFIFSFLYFCQKIRKIFVFDKHMYEFFSEVDRIENIFKSWINYTFQKVRRISENYKLSRRL